LVQEYPQAPIRHVDLAEIEDLYVELAQQDQQSQIAWRNHARFHPLFKKAQKVEGKIAFDPKGEYLITGGFGALGLILAEWLASHGVQKLLLCGRQLPSEKATKALQTLEAK